MYFRLPPSYCDPLGERSFTSLAGSTPSTRIHYSQTDVVRPADLPIGNRKKQFIANTTPSPPSLPRPVYGRKRKGSGYSSGPSQSAKRIGMYRKQMRDQETRRRSWQPPSPLPCERQRWFRCAQAEKIYKGIGNSSRAPFICPRAMRASANHTSQPVKRGGCGSTKAERPIVGICFVHFYAFSVLFDSYTSWINRFEQLSYLLCFNVCILIGFLAIIIFFVPLSSFHRYLCLSLLC